MTVELLTGHSETLEVGDIVRRKEEYGRGKPTAIIEVGSCRDYPTKPPYYHSCEDKMAILVEENGQVLVAHSDMYEKV
jgi:hypothetical protein